MPKARAFLLQQGRQDEDCLLSANLPPYGFPSIADTPSAMTSAHLQTGSSIDGLRLKQSTSMASRAIWLDEGTITKQKGCSTPTIGVDDEEWRLVALALAGLATAAREDVAGVGAAGSVLRDIGGL
ncbi:hypothetical protein C8Q79DRAFT_1013966 [Trametes meyenii]|nr:hypothetical protein C8Q79DRAFT_1013966 [Trametes meyenii]